MEKIDFIPEIIKAGGYNSKGKKQVQFDVVLLENVLVAMEKYADYKCALATQQIKSTEQQCNIADVSSLACKHEWIMTADEFGQTCYCKKCNKSS